MLEVGLGGRLDAVNVVGRRCRDRGQRRHSTTWTGSARTARPSGARRPGSTAPGARAICGDRDPPRVAARARRTRSARGCCVLGRDFDGCAADGRLGPGASVDGCTARSAASGDARATARSRNAARVLDGARRAGGAACRCRRGAIARGPAERACCAGASRRWRAGGVERVLDVAHNAGGGAVLAAHAARAAGRPAARWRCAAMLRDKPIVEAVAQLAPLRGVRRPAGMRRCHGRRAARRSTPA
ncbi:MAG: hypothetical protein MZV65_34240 [Chromatiales bacterium]|nr:hypothetical protein [Chromatiales bacterium]